MCCYFIHSYAAIFLHDSFSCCNAFWCHHSVCLTGRGQSVTELMPSMNFPVHPYTCCSDKHTSPYWTFIRRWISMGFAPSLLKETDNRTLFFLFHGASGAATYTILLRRRVAFLHRTAICRSLFKPSVSLLSTYRQSSCVSNCCRTCKVFIWLSLVCMYVCMYVCM